MSVAAAILAAGASTRLGEPKQLAILGGERLLERAVRTATEAACEPVLVILGSHARQIHRECDLRAAKVIINHAWQTGMASSIHAALRSLPLDADGLVLMVCDQPAVSPDHIRRLIDRSGNAVEEGAAGTVAVSSRYAGRVGIPAYFPASRFQELLQVRGDQGARALLEDSPAIDLPGGELDIDTPPSLQSARQRFEGAPSPDTNFY